tara:strand:- start:411 stop:995 length:585 start_codon:yes stop_codon:yes gene_type:complete
MKEMKEEIMKQEWTDGIAKVLKTIATPIGAQEKERHNADEDYYADPQLYIQDLVTGASVMITTDTSNTTGKTGGNGYRSCSAVTQRMTSKLPTKKIVGRLVSMMVRNFVPVDASPEVYSTMVAKFIDDTAKEIANESKWSPDDTKHADAVNKAISDLLEHTVSTRAGDTLLNVKATPMTAMIELQKSEVIYNEL